MLTKTLLFTGIFAACGLLLGQQAVAQKTERASVDSNGQEANGSSSVPAISANGRYVAFHSAASNLVPDDTNVRGDIFVRDRKKNTTTRVSVATGGAQANGESFPFFSISANGRYVAFSSAATNLVAGDSNGQNDVFVHDRTTGKTTRVSVRSNGKQANGHSGGLSISADGRYVAFVSGATNLVAKDTNGSADVFVHDRKTKKTERVSVRSDGKQANGFSSGPSISADGRFVAFHSAASNLVGGDTNVREDVFVHDRKTKKTTRVSVRSNGQQANGYSGTAAINANGRFVAFHSVATNLVAGDTNNQPEIFVHDRKTKKTIRVSVTSKGKQANGASYNPSISGNGRFVAFESSATNLVPKDTNARRDVFVRDWQTNKTTRVSISSDGAQADGESRFPAISGNGRFVAFESFARYLVPDTNNAWDIFVHDSKKKKKKKNAGLPARLGSGASGP